MMTLIEAGGVGGVGDTENQFELLLILCHQELIRNPSFFSSMCISLQI